MLILLLLLTLHQFGANDSPIRIGAGVQKGMPGNSDSTGAEKGVNGTGQFSIELNAYPTFRDGNSKGNLNIVNPASNQLSIQVEIELKDTGQIVYQSGTIPPGHYVGDDKLAEILRKGEYEAMAAVSPFDPENPDQQFNRANFDLVVIIKN